jgi:hypothetical protein
MVDLRSLDKVAISVTLVFDIQDVPLPFLFIITLGALPEGACGPE